MMHRDVLWHRGLALVAVLWMVAALSLLVASVIAVSRGSTQSAQNHTALVRATAIGDAGIQLALTEWRHEPSMHDRLFVRRYVFGGRVVDVELIPSSAYIDISTAPPDLLQALLVVAGGLDPAAAETLAARIVDWRDPDDSASPGGGSELAPYLAAGLSVRPRNGPFLGKEDLLQVAGIGLDLFARIEPLITVWGASGRVDPQFAPERVLFVLAQGDAGRVAAIMEQRSRGGATLDTSALNPAHVGGGGASVLHARATVTMEDGARVARSRWLEIWPGPDGTPWQAVATEPARYLPAPPN